MNPQNGKRKTNKKENKRTTNNKNKNKTMEKTGVFEGGGRKNSHIIFKKVC